MLFKNESPSLYGFIDVNEACELFKNHIWLVSHGGVASEALCDILKIQYPEGNANLFAKSVRESTAHFYTPLPYGPDKAIYLFGSPIESIISQINRFEKCATNPAKLHNNQAFPAFKSLTELCEYAEQHHDFDPFGIAKQFFNFLYSPPVAYPILFVRHDMLEESIHEVAGFVGLNEDVQWIRKKRQSSIESLPTDILNCLEKLYAPLTAFMNTMPPLFLKSAHEGGNNEVCGYDDAGDIALKILSIQNMAGEQALMVQLILHNRSSKTLSTCQDDLNGVYISYHWLNADTKQFCVYNGERHSIIPSISAGYSYSYFLKINIPPELSSDLYILRMTLVQEKVGWFDNAEQPVFDDVLVEILGK